MKKYFMIGLIMALVAPNMCPAYSYRVQQLIAEKQAKLKKLESCKGTTKNLKIAGLSTLGITAVGVGANVAEAVILNKEKGKLNTAKNELAVAEQKYNDAKEKQYRQSMAKQYGYQQDINNRTCNATLDSVASRDSALVVAKNYLDANGTDPKCKLPGTVLSGCDDKVERNGGYATLSCVMDFIHEGDTVSKTHYYNFKYKIGIDAGAPFNEEVTGCDNAIKKVKAEDSEITGSCSCNGDIVTCEKNPFVDKTFKFGKIILTAEEEKAQKSPREIVEFKDVFGLYRADPLAQAKRLLDWWKANRDDDVEPGNCNTIDKNKNTVTCGNVTVLFADVNKLYEDTTAFAMGKYFCSKIGGDWSGKNIAGQAKHDKCTKHDDWVKSCVNYVFGSTIYSGTNVKSVCETIDYVNKLDQKAIVKKQLAEAAEAKAEAETKAKYCSYINCDVSKCTFGENADQSDLYSVMCNSDSNTLKCYSKDDSDTKEYNCKNGSEVNVVNENDAQVSNNNADKTAKATDKLKNPEAVNQAEKKEEYIGGDAGKTIDTDEDKLNAIVTKVQETFDQGCRTAKDQMRDGLRKELQDESIDCDDIDEKGVIRCPVNDLKATVQFDFSAMCLTKKQTEEIDKFATSVEQKTDLKCSGMLKYISDEMDKITNSLGSNCQEEDKISAICAVGGGNAGSYIFKYPNCTKD